MFPISLLSSSVYSLILDFFYLISFCSFFIISIVLCPFSLPPFHLLQFLSNLAQYSSSYFLSDHLNNFFTINLPGNSLLLKVSSSLSCFLISSMSCWYSFSNSSTAFFALPRFSFSSQVLDSAVNPFHCTKYLSFSFIYCLFRILSTFHSSSLIMTRAGCSFFCPSTCSIYLCILLMLTTRCIFTVLGSSNSTMFNDTIFFIQ